MACTAAATAASGAALALSTWLIIVPAEAHTAPISGSFGIPTATWLCFINPRMIGSLVCTFGEVGICPTLAKRAWVSGSENKARNLRAALRASPFELMFR